MILRCDGYDMPGCLTTVFVGISTGPSGAVSPKLPASGRSEAALASDYRRDLEVIKEEWAEAGRSNLHVQFMRRAGPTIGDWADP